MFLLRLKPVMSLRSFGSQTLSRFDIKAAEISAAALNGSLTQRESSEYDTFMLLSSILNVVLLLKSILL